MAFLVAPFISGVFGPHPVLKMIPWVIESILILAIATRLATAKPVSELSTFTCNHWIVSDFYDGSQYTVDGKIFEFQCGQVMSGLPIRSGFHATTLHDCVEMCTQEEGCAGTSYIAHDHTCHLLSSDVIVSPYTGEGEAVAALLVSSTQLVDATSTTNSTTIAISVTIQESKSVTTSAGSYASQTGRSSGSIRNTRSTTIPTSRAVETESVQTQSSANAPTTAPKPITMVRVSNRPNKNRETPQAGVVPKFRIFLGLDSVVRITETPKHAALPSNEVASTTETMDAVLEL